MDEARALAQAGQFGAAVALVEKRAESGDEEALLSLASWRIHGVNGPRKPVQAYSLVEGAAAKGSIEALRLKAYLTGNGTGCSPDFVKARRILEEAAERDAVAAREVALLSRMPDAGELALSSEQLSGDPEVRLVRRLFTPEECEHICARAEPRLAPSMIIDPRSGHVIPNPIRTSEGTNFGPTEEDLVLQALVRRVAAATGTDPACGEPLHVLRYKPGEEYRPHLDALPGVSNQREITVLIYLNDDFQGGETNFPLSGLTAKGAQGDALMFRNLDTLGQVNVRSRHAGLPVASGTKWLATRWIRRAPYDPLSP